MTAALRRLVVAVVVALGAAMIAVVLGAAGVARAQPQSMPLDEQFHGNGEAPEVFLVTFGEGVQIFEKFGHGALCLHYPSAPVVRIKPEFQRRLADIGARAGLPPGALATTTCFNYGITDFREGAIMIWNFLRTKQRFWVDTESLADMALFYSGQTPLGAQLQEDRDVWLQRLPLTDDQARQIEKKLYSDIQEENRYYYYDHFFDNCTTRLRDMIDTATDHKLHEGGDEEYGPTYRQMGYRGIAELQPLVGGADFVIGRQLEDHPTKWLAMFHPDVLRATVEAKLGAKPVLIYQRKGPPFPQSGWTGPFYYLLAALLFAVPLALARWRGRFMRLALGWATFELFIWGALIWTLVIISSIPGLRWNEAVFVFVPFDIALPFLGPRRRRGYARVRVGMLILASLLRAVGVFRQPLWVPILTAFLPLAMIAFDWPRVPVTAAPPAEPAPTARAGKRPKQRR